MLSGLSRIFRKPFANVHISRKVPFAHVWQIYACGPRTCKTSHGCLHGAQSDMQEMRVAFSVLPQDQQAVVVASELALHAERVPTPQPFPSVHHHPASAPWLSCAGIGLQFRVWLSRFSEIEPKLESETGRVKAVDDAAPVLWMVLLLAIGKLNLATSTDAPQHLNLHQAASLDSLIFSGK